MEPQDSPKARYMVYCHDTYEPYAVFFIQRVGAEKYFNEHTGTGEGIYLVEILKQK